LTADNPQARRWPWWWAFALLFAVQFLSGAVMQPQRSLFPVYGQTDMAYSAFLIAVLSSLRQGLGILAAPVGGALADTFGDRWTLILGVTELVAGALVFLTHSSALVILFWTYSGFAAGVRTIGSQGYLIAAVRPELLGSFSGLYNLSMTLGGALASAGAGPLVDMRGFAAFGWALLGMAGVALAASWALPRTGQRTRATKGNWRATLSGYGDLIRRPLILIIALLRFLPTCYWGVALVFIPLWLYDLSHSATVVALYGTVSMVVASAAQWGIGYLADRAGRRMPTIASTIGIVISAAGLASLDLWGASVGAIYVLGTIGAAAAWSLSVLMPCLVAEVAAVEERGRVLGWLHLLWNAAMLVGSLLGGVLFALSAGAPFLATALLNVATVALAALFFRRLSRPLAG